MQICPKFFFLEIPPCAHHVIFITKVVLLIKIPPFYEIHGCSYQGIGSRGASVPSEFRSPVNQYLCENSQTNSNWALRTPLYQASLGGHLEIVIYLIKKGTNPKIRTSDGKTVYDWVIDYLHHSDMSNYLQQFNLVLTRLLLKSLSNKNQPMSTKLGLSCNFCVFWSYFSSRIIQFFCSHSNAHMIGDFFFYGCWGLFFLFFVFVFSKLILKLHRGASSYVFFSM